MKKKHIISLIFLLGAALCGVMVMQFYYLKESYKLKAALFDRSVSEAFLNVSAKVEKQEMLRHLERRKQIFAISDSSKPSKNSQKKRKKSSQKNNAPKINSRIQKDLELFEKVQRDFERKFFNTGVDSVNWFFDEPFARERKTEKPWLDHDKKRYADSIKNLRHQLKLIKEIIQDFDQEKPSLDKRVVAEDLQNIIRQELKTAGIDIPYQFALLSTKDRKQIFSSDTAFHPLSTRKEYYQFLLFAHDIFDDTGTVVIHFPERESAIFHNMMWMFLSSLLLLIVIIYCFGYAINTILTQKKISEMKTDFINNMTHEFKTPVSTIMIASEALQNERVRSDATRVLKLAKMIHDENLRLNSHIERVLNIAKIELKDFKLDQTSIDMNHLVQNVASSMALQMEKKQAELNIEIKAEKSTIIGDELHLSNVVMNLLDNALKYSKEHPSIGIKTYNPSSEEFVIRIKDNGIGMSKEHLSKIFDQFYRVSTGNVHNVKGFGLGLSYVNTIVHRMNGKINVKSELGKGSIFEIKFLLAK